MAIDILEKAQQSKHEIQRKDPEEGKTGWNKFMDFMNPFKCG
jgi:hypothetical protein